MFVFCTIMCMLLNVHMRTCKHKFANVYNCMYVYDVCITERMRVYLYMYVYVNAHVHILRNVNNVNL